MKYLPNRNKRYEVYVDGEKASHVIEADSEEGYAICAKLPLEVDENNNLITYTLYGNITVEEIEENQ